MSGLGDAATIVTAATAVTAVAGGYVQFVLKRSVLPSAQFDVQFTPYMRGESQLVGEVELVFKNVGSTMLVVTGVRSRVRYRLKNDLEMPAANDIAEPAFPSKVLRILGWPQAASCPVRCHHLSRPQRRGYQ